MKISLDDSVSLVFPAHNAERWLASTTERLLSLCAELSPQFEVVIADNGSVDDTTEIARELSRKFPQVRWWRLEWRIPIDAINQRAQREINNRYLLLVGDPQQVGASELKRLWDTRRQPSLALARSDGRCIRFDSGNRASARESVTLLHLANLQPEMRAGSSLRLELT